MDSEASWKPMIAHSACPPVHMSDTEDEAKMEDSPKDSAITSPSVDECLSSLAQALHVPPEMVDPALPLLKAVVAMVLESAFTSPHPVNGSEVKPKGMRDTMGKVTGVVQLVAQVLPIILDAVDSNL